MNVELTEKQFQIIYDALVDIYSGNAMPLNMDPSVTIEEIGELLQELDSQKDFGS